MHPQRVHKGHVTKNVQRQCNYKELMKLSKKSMGRRERRMTKEILWCNMVIFIFSYVFKQCAMVD